MKASIQKSIYLLVVLAVSFANAQSSEKIKGNGNVTKKTVTTSGYDSVKVTGFFNVELIAGSEGQIIIEGENNLLDYIECKVEGGALLISVRKEKRIRPSAGKNITITVPFQTLHSIALSGSGDVATQHTIKSEKFTVILSGSGNVNLDVEAQEMNANVAGSGNMTLKGNADALAANITGSGNLEAFGLESENVESKLTGSGKCQISCIASLHARVVGSGNINYKGEPKKKDTKVTGTGKILKS